MLEITSDFLSSLYSLFLSYGFAGAFIVSLLGSLILFFPSPYLLPVALMALETRFDPFVLTLVSALGATIAKTIIFRASYVGQRIVSQETRRRMRPLQKLVSRYGWVAAFLGAATPIPDDIIYIPLGFSRYDIKRFFVATLAGKMIITGAVVWGARMFGVPAVQLLIGTFADARIVALIAVGFVGLVGAIMYAIVKTDWGKLLSRWFPWTVEE